MDQYGCKLEMTDKFWCKCTILYITVFVKLFMGYMK
jgi:hypothetical protein